MKTIFKKGDTVYWGQLKGEVITITDNPLYPVKVLFDNGEWSSFTKDGRHYKNLPRVLSFTEYTLEGFSQERPCEFKDGDSVWVRDTDNNEWIPLVFKEYKDGKFYTYDVCGEFFGWEQCKPFKTEEDERN